ncbi:hypothetical protein [Pseudorhodobacter sp.]|uniref:hypothetical protein n=1 Tax=Pseudorhodobacter sp. TaxID=1934400 RepID=UPI002AFDF440|nr:hypothetical protein [Pseudorhodobacter sp.]
MTSIHNTQPPHSQFRPGPRLAPLSRPRPRSVLPEADHQKLQQHLTCCQQSQLPIWTLLAYVLLNKIMTTEPVSDFHARDLVTSGCRVSYSVNGEPAQTGLLVHSARSEFGSGVIPVSSLLGATLIGMRIGQRAPLLCEDGTVMSLSVLDVLPPN